MNPKQRERLRAAAAQQSASQHEKAGRYYAIQKAVSNDLRDAIIKEELAKSIAYVPTPKQKRKEALMEKLADILVQEIRGIKKTKTTADASTSTDAKTTSRRRHPTPSPRRRGRPVARRLPTPPPRRVARRQPTPPPRWLRRRQPTPPPRRKRCRVARRKTPPQPQSRVARRKTPPQPQRRGCQVPTPISTATPRARGSPRIGAPRLRRPNHFSGCLSRRVKKRPDGLPPRLLF
jgi:hypothetical protein